MPGLYVLFFFFQHHDHTKDLLTEKTHPYKNQGQWDASGSSMVYLFCAECILLPPLK